MQSQQKKVKWSRGETADALEERTDTGITQVSVSKLENIIADIYGNISRRPALKIVAQANKHPVTPVVTQTYNAGNFFPVVPSTFVFTINQNKYIIFIAGERCLDGFLIENEKFVRKVNITGVRENELRYAFGKNGGASFAQSNNWGILSNVWDETIVMRLTDTDDITTEIFQFSAPWYAPNGTQTMQVTSNEITGLSFDASTIANYTYTEHNGITTVYSWINTGIAASTISGVWDADTTTFYLTAPTVNDTPYISTTPDNHVFTQWTMTNGTTYASNQTLATYGILNLPVKIFINSTQAYFDFIGTATYDVTSKLTLPTIPLAELIPAGSIVQFPNNGAYMRVEGYASNGTNLMMYGSLLTPVAKDNATDSRVKVETGYVSLQEYKPTEFMFSGQRLFATKWQTEYSLDQPITEIPGYVVGSQIARYNDFKNDYNTQAEPVVIDISTMYQEKVNYIADYNGLKIFTTDTEYAYSAQNGVVKQSTNGCSPNCRPVVFGSTLLYADKSMRQIRALQYEFQTDIFQSNVINQMCQHDLIFNPVAMVPQYDKENHTGSFLYVVQEPKLNSAGAQTTTPAIATCNFVPGNQAEIWSRWATPMQKEVVFNHDLNTIVNAVVVNNKPWFVVMGQDIVRTTSVSNLGMTFSLAELDYDNLLDFEVTANPTDTRYAPTQNNGGISLEAWKGTDNSIIYTKYYDPLALERPQVGDPVYNENALQVGTISAVDTYSTQITYHGIVYQRHEASNIIVHDLVFPGATVSVFDGDTYMWDDTLDEYGRYTKPLTELTAPRVGFMINATLESHPIDIGGKTYTEKKRIGKAVAVIRNTDAGAFTVCDKTGYTSPDKKTVNFYGCTGMKDQVRYTIKNIKGARFTIESLTMIIEYGTLES